MPSGLSARAEQGVNFAQLPGLGRRSCRLSAWGAGIGLSEDGGEPDQGGIKEVRGGRQYSPVEAAVE